MKKVAIVVNDSWAAYNFRFNIGLALKNYGYEVVYICPRNRYSKLIEEEFDFINIELNTKSTNPMEDIKTIYRYYKIYKQVQPDIVLQYSIKPNIYGTIAASMLNIYTINNIAGLGTLFMQENILTKIVKWLYKTSQKKATKVFFQNKDDFKIFIDENLVQENKCDVLPGSGVDIEKFKPLEKKENKKFVFLLVSRMLWAKGIGEYVEAAKKLNKKYKNIEFQLLGQVGVKSPTAISRRQIDVWVQEGNINYLGSSDDVRVEIAKADCIVLPSFYREGTPRVLLESASMAKPIITTDNVGCRDVVEDGVNGYLCEVKNSKDLSDKMEIMLNLTNKERESMGKSGRKKILKEFNEKLVIDKYLKSISEILK